MIFLSEKNCEHYPFELLPLPYEHCALEPYIDAKTVEVHHHGHLGTYVKNLNAALESCPAYQCCTLCELLEKSSSFPWKLAQTVRHNGGGIYNHEFYFKGLTPSGDDPSTMQARMLPHAIERCFGSIDAFKEAFKAAALSVFGSGYAWLLTDCCGRLCITTTINQETTLPLCKERIFCIDVWEHAYYLKYQNKRAEYIDAIFCLLNWEIAEKYFLAATNCRV